MIAALKTVWPYMRRYRLALVLGLLALALKDLAGAVIPLITRAGVDTVMGGETLGRLWWVCGSIVAAALFKGFFQYWMRVLLVGLSRDVEYDIRNDLFARLASLNHDFYQRPDRRAHDARSGDDVLGRNVAHVRSGRRRDGRRGLAADAVGAVADAARFRGCGAIRTSNSRAFRKNSGAFLGY
jgi:ABC-type multidrug transport system fused ATPase/permease subunit